MTVLGLLAFRLRSENRWSSSQRMAIAVVGVILMEGRAFVPASVMAAQAAWGAFMLKAAFGGVRTPNDVSIGLANVAEAAARPAQRKLERHHDQRDHAAEDREIERGPVHVVGELHRGSGQGEQGGGTDPGDEAEPAGEWRGGERGHDP